MYIYMRILVYLVVESSVFERVQKKPRRRLKEANLGLNLVLEGRLELPRVTPLAPKASAYTNSATPAMCSQ